MKDAKAEWNGGNVTDINYAVTSVVDVTVGQTRTNHTISVKTMKSTALSSVRCNGIIFSENEGVTQTAPYINHSY